MQNKKVQIIIIIIIIITIYYETRTVLHISARANKHIYLNR